jgi:D-alanine-D-alanine ligase
MPLDRDPEALARRLRQLEQALVERAEDLALLLAFDRPQRVADRPGLARMFFAQRCVSDAQLTQIINAFREVGAYVELFAGELPFLAALADGRISALPQTLKVVYNEIEGGITRGGFQPGRKALIPTVADAYGLMCSNSNAYACAIGRHKFHYSTVLSHLGVRTPRTWHFRPPIGWAGGLRPDDGLKVIAKSTYENWSVGVTDKSIFHVDGSCDDRVAALAAEIGQPVTVQEFISGPEVGVSVLACPELLIPPPMKTILTKAPDDPDAVMTIYDNLEDKGIVLEPYDGPPAVMSELYAMSARSFSGLELGAFARFDFRVDDDQRTWLTDVGVSPGISQKDAAFLSLVELGFDHPSFLRTVVATTLTGYGRLG